MHPGAVSVVSPVQPPQAVSRVWRYGQQRPCFIYHLMYAGTFETRVFERVLVKEELFQRVSHYWVTAVMAVGWCLLHGHLALWQQSPCLLSMMCMFRRDDCLC